MRRLLLCAEVYEFSDLFWRAVFSVLLGCVLVSVSGCGSDETAHEVRALRSEIARLTNVVDDIRTEGITVKGVPTCSCHGCDTQSCKGECCKCAAPEKPEELPPPKPAPPAPKPPVKPTQPISRPAPKQLPPCPKVSR